MGAGADHRNPIGCGAKAISATDMVAGKRMEVANMGTNTDQLSEAELIRVVYSMRDFERSSSALIFLGDDKQEQDNNRAHNRRHYCYETTAVVCYMRPFSSAHGEIKPLSLPDLDIELTSEELDLHDRLRTLRDKVFAHSDFAKMEFRLDPIKVGEDETPPYFPLLNVPEGAGLLTSKDISVMDALIRKLIHKLCQTVNDYVQRSTEPLVISGGKIHRSPPAE